MDGLNGIDLSGIKEAISLEPIIIRLGMVDIRFRMNVDGSETQLQFINANPIFPFGFEIPFMGDIYLERFINNTTTLLERAREAQTT